MAAKNCIRGPIVWALPGVAWIDVRQCLFIEIFERGNPAMALLAGLYPFFVTLHTLYGVAFLAELQVMLTGFWDYNGGVFVFAHVLGIIPDTCNKSNIVFPSRAYAYIYI
jgi:hypothetical protein